MPDHPDAIQPIIGDLRRVAKREACYMLARTAELTAAIRERLTLDARRSAREKNVGGDKAASKRPLKRRLVLLIG